MNKILIVTAIILITSCLIMLFRYSYFIVTGKIFNFNKEDIKLILETTVIAIVLYVMLWIGIAIVGV